MTPAEAALARKIRRAARPLSGALGDYDPLLERIGGRRLVLIGEASHGTHEFYRERAVITKRLIAEKGFTAVAVEADWPDAYRVNRYVLLGKAGGPEQRGCARGSSGFPPGCGATQMSSNSISVARGRTTTGSRPGIEGWLRPARSVQSASTSSHSPRGVLPKSRSCMLVEPPQLVERAARGRRRAGRRGRRERPRVAAVALDDEQRRRLLAAAVAARGLRRGEARDQPLGERLPCAGRERRARARRPSARRDEDVPLRREARPGDPAGPVHALRAGVASRSRRSRRRRRAAGARGRRRRR